MGMGSESQSKKNKISHEGVPPIITQIVGVFLVGYATLAGCYNAYWTLAEISFQLSPLEIITYLGQAIFLFVVLFTILSLPGIIIGTLFPPIRITTDTIEYRFLFVRGKVSLDEVERVVRIQKPFSALAIVIHRPLGIMRGLWLATIHGMLVSLHQPVILISGNREKKKQLEELLGIDAIETEHT
jgi:hypothetical protein